MRVLLSASALAIVSLGACGTPPPPVINPEPVFDKLGEGECPERYVYVPGALFEGTCEPEPEEEERPDRDPERPRDPTIGVVSFPDPQ